uniref:40S ribosomal protein S29 n=1 Tax=Spermophilus dauricus TaxID=99837 RepID=A0A8C9P3M1_SPEDA
PVCQRLEVPNEGIIPGLQCSHSCQICSNLHSVIQKYGLNMCCQCFHLYVKVTGFFE